MPYEIFCVIAQEYVRLGGSPRKLAQTCSVLFYAINSMKNLWNTIYCGEDENPYSEYEVSLPYVNLLYLIWFKPPVGCKNLEYFQLLLQRAVPAPLDIIIDDPNLQSAIFRALQPFTCLRRLYVECQPDEDEDPHFLEEVARVNPLDLESLETQDLSATYIIALQNMANRSQRKKFSLSHANECYLDLSKSFQHPLFQRITTLSLHICKSHAINRLTLFWWLSFYKITMKLI